MRLRWLTVLVVLVFVVAGCGGDDGDSVGTTEDPPPDDTPEDTDDDASDEVDEPADAEEPEEAGGDVPVQNYFTIEGEVYPITIGTCFQSPGVDLEVLASISGVDGSDAYAYVYAAEEGSPELTLSAFRVSDAAGLDWSNESGEGATNLAMEGKGISGEVPVTSPDGATATAVFDFVCPG